MQSSLLGGHLGVNQNLENIENGALMWEKILSDLSKHEEKVITQIHVDMFSCKHNLGSLEASFVGVHCQ